MTAVGGCGERLGYHHWGDCGAVCVAGVFFGLHFTPNNAKGSRVITDTAAQSAALAILQ